MGKFISEKEVPKTDEKCPKCGSQLNVYFGEMYDWDVISCSNYKCNYEKELDTTTCHEQDGRIYQIKKEE